MNHVDELFRLADLWQESDPCGASVLRRGARKLAAQQCIRCQEQYKSGYAAGYRIGLRTGENSWTEGLDRGAALRKELGHE